MTNHTPVHTYTTTHPHTHICKYVLHWMQLNYEYTDLKSEDNIDVTILLNYLKGIFCLSWGIAWNNRTIFAMKICQNNYVMIFTSKSLNNAKSTNIR